MCKLCHLYRTVNEGRFAVDKRLNTFGFCKIFLALRQKPLLGEKAVTPGRNLRMKHICFCNNFILIACEGHKPKNYKIGTFRKLGTEVTPAAKLLFVFEIQMHCLAMKNRKSLKKDLVSHSARRTALFKVSLKIM